MSLSAETLRASSVLLDRVPRSEHPRTSEALSTVLAKEGSMRGGPAGLATRITQPRVPD